MNETHVAPGVLEQDFSPKGDNVPRTTVIKRCPFCGWNHQITLSVDDWFAYRDGALIQNAFPYLQAGQRELIMTGICPDCFPTEEAA